jgi:hypothetical protein
MSEVWVSLSWEWVERAAVIGIKRQVENLQRSRPDAHGCQRDLGWQVHIDGACGEAAVAKYTRTRWNGNLGRLKAKDVGALQVRTSSRQSGRLILHPDDPDDDAYVLVLGSAPRYRLAGWIFGHEGKQQEWWEDPTGYRPAFFVPQSAMHPMDLLEVSR